MPDQMNCCVICKQEFKPGEHWTLWIPPDRDWAERVHTYCLGKVDGDETETNPMMEPIPEHIREIRDTMLKQGYAWEQVQEILKDLGDKGKIS
jgi:hypothetical protein